MINLALTMRTANNPLNAFHKVMVKPMLSTTKPVAAMSTLFTSDNIVIWWGGSQQYINVSWPSE